MWTRTNVASLRIHLHLAVLACYTAVAVVFWWPLPLHLGDYLPGPAGGDTGVYVWNLWLFRHEIMAHQKFPFETLEILNAAGSTGVPLSLHNYTPFVAALALPLIGWIGLVPTFNVLVVGNGVLTAYAMFLYARTRTGDAGAAFVGGLVFGFSPFMMARSSEHFSLAQAAPLPIFGLLMLELFQRPGFKVAALAGITVAWAYLSDPYYAVYCVLIALFTIGYSIVSVERRAPEVRRVWWPTVLTLLILCTAGVVAGIIFSGGGQADFLGISVSMHQLYTPVFVLTVLSAVRIWMLLAPRITWQMPFGRMHMRAAGVASVFALLALMPVVSALTSPGSDGVWNPPRVWWRSSAPGVDVLAWLLPNPLHPWFGGIAPRWLSSLPNGYVENIASIPWTAAALIGVAGAVAGFRGTRGWWAFLALFALLSLGPFIHFGGVNTYVPTPWAMLRYVPGLGAARMPTRMTILVMLGVAMLLSLAVARLRERFRYRSLVLAGSVTVVLIELLPAPRPLFSATVPQVTRIIASDQRAIRVMNLPFGLKDGLTSRGAFSTAYQYYQTSHEKPLMGGYLSRLPAGSLERYGNRPILDVLLRLSEKEPVSGAALAAATAEGPGMVADARLGYVLVDRGKASTELLAFAEKAFSLKMVAVEGGFVLYRTALID